MLEAKMKSSQAVFEALGRTWRNESIQCKQVNQVTIVTGVFSVNKSIR